MNLYIITCTLKKKRSWFCVGVCMGDRLGTLKNGRTGEKRQTQQIGYRILCSPWFALWTSMF